MHHRDASSRGLVFLNQQAHFHIILHESLLYLLRQDQLPRGRFAKGERKPTQGLGPRQRNHGHHQYGSSRGLVFLNHQGCPGVAHFHIILHESLLYLLRQDSLPWGKTFKAIEAG